MNFENDTWENSRWDISTNRDKTDAIWQLFHENSKIGRNTFVPLSDQQILKRMEELSLSLSYEKYPQIKLPDQLCHLDLSLGEILINRRTASEMTPTRLSLQQIATLLHYSYGVTRDNKNTKYTRPFRVVPSGGALYPLDIYFHSSSINEIKPGFYHYNPLTNYLSLLKEGDYTDAIADRMILNHIPRQSSLIIFVSALFERSVFKYSDKGYRFVLIEAGHVGQNIDLVSTAMDLEVMNLGGYYDREIDELLDFDGINQSTVYMAAVSGKKMANK